MHAVFFNCDGLIVQICKPNGKTITGKFYKNGVWSKVKANYEKCRLATGFRGLCLIHDNAPAHKCVFVHDFLKEEKVGQLSHHLIPCNFFLFPLLKKTLSGHCYESRSAFGSAIFKCLRGIPKKAYFSAFTEWILRLEKCVSVKGEHFEGLK